MGRPRLAAQLLYLWPGAVGWMSPRGSRPWRDPGGSGDYLIGFLAAARSPVRRQARRGPLPLRTLLLFALASAVIYLIGTAWLCLDTGMSVREGISAGVTPFRPGDSVKVLLAAGLLPGVWRLAGRGTGKGIAQ